MVRFAQGFLRDQSIALSVIHLAACLMQLPVFFIELCTQLLVQIGVFCRFDCSVFQFVLQLQVICFELGDRAHLWAQGFDLIAVLLGKQLELVVAHAHFVEALQESAVACWLHLRLVF